MTRKLPRVSASEDKTSRLPRHKQIFRIAIETKLDNGYEFKDMTQAHVKELHRFISDTVYKGLTILEVDKQYLRKEGLSDAPPVKYKGDIELIHYGKDRNAFRIYGYYNADNYFVICRIDGAHQTHSIIGVFF